MSKVTIASKGVQGARGPEGPRGLQGLRGEKGDTGDVTPEALAARDAAQGAASAAAGSAATATDKAAEAAASAALAGGQVDSIAAMLTVPTRSGGQRISVKEFAVGTGVGGGEFYWDAASTEADDGGTVFKLPAVSVGRWKRILPEGRRVSPEMFGALGDKTADDTLAVQRAFNVADGVIELTPNRKYRITAPINMDLRRIRRVNGNNAILVVDADVVALKVTGTHVGSASPATVLGTVLNTQMNPIIDGLRITCDRENEGDFVGVGIEVQGAYGLQLTRCHIYKLKTGIRYIGINRNIIMHANHIWHCFEYGVHMLQGDLHQVIFTSNHVSYCRKLLFFDRTEEITDWQIVGNGLEMGSFPAGHLGNCIHFYHARGQGVTISGNTIESHLYDGSDLIRMEGSATHFIEEMRIVGNKFARQNGANSAAIWFNLAYRYVIANNTARDLMGPFIKAELINGASAVVVQGNVVGGFAGTTSPARPRSGGELFIADGGGYTLQDILIADNIAHQGGRVEIKNGSVGGSWIGATITNNQLSWASGRVTDFIIKISEGINTLRRTTISGNIIRSQTAGNITGGMSIGPAIAPSGLLYVRVTDNTSDPAGNHVLPTASAGYPYVVIRDNI